MGRAFVRAVLVVGSLSCAIGCASGSSAGGDEPPGSLGGGGGTDAGPDGDASLSDAEAGPAPGQPGAVCASDADCAKGKCASIGRNGTPKVCVVPCTTGQACPSGLYCEWLGASGYQCVPDRSSLCSLCTKDDTCLDPADRCFEAPAGDRFCARDCSFDGACPSGYECVDGDVYAGIDGGAPEGGASDGGPGDAGPTDAATDGPAGWPDGGTGKPDAGGADAGGGAKKGDRYCVPAHGLSCACDSARDKVTRACAKKGPAGTCTGTQACDGASGAWSACNAADPIAETCNGKDDDCDGVADDGDGNQLCASMGLPPHGSWACEAGKCALGGCDHGWTNFPPGSGSGCTCAVDPGEPNDQCAQAQAIGSVSDATPGSLQVTGTLSWSTDVDWYAFDAADVAQGSANTYHVHVGFTQNPGNEFAFDIIRGPSCLSPAQNNSGAGLTDYDWCVDFGGSQGGLGELSCADATPGLNHCRNHTSKYWLRVWRKPGATATCGLYGLEITGSGAGSTTCDATSACDPQTP